MTYKRQDKRPTGETYIIEIWLGEPAGWSWIIDVPSLEGARARCEYTAEKLGLAYRVVDGDGKEQGRWTGIKP